MTRSGRSRYLGTSEMLSILYSEEASDNPEVIENEEFEESDDCGLDPGWSPNDNNDDEGMLDMFIERYEDDVLESRKRLRYR